MRYGSTLRSLAKKPSMSTTRSLITGRPGSGAMLILRPSWSTRILQASRLRPLMSMASEPHTPWAQDRRNVRLPSCSHLIVWSRSSDASHRFGLHLVGLPVRLGVPLGVVAEDADVDLHRCLGLQ